MKPSVFRSLIFSAAAIAGLYFAVALTEVVDAVAGLAHAYRTIRHWAVRIFMAPVAMSARSGDLVDRAPAILLVAARSFLARCVRRARPQIEARWRMCASA